MQQEKEMIMNMDRELQRALRHKQGKLRKMQIKKKKKKNRKEMQWLLILRGLAETQIRQHPFVGETVQEEASLHTRQCLSKQQMH